MSAIRESTVPAIASHFGSHHAVQFYEKEEFLYDVVATFAADGLVAGEPVVIIATKDHCDGFLARLRERGFDCDKAGVTFVDAREALSSFMNGRSPDEHRFRTEIGGLIQRSAGASQKRVRMYGEMVDLLWRDGEAEAAIRLEELWNALAHRQSFSLLCAYPIGHFYKESDVRTFEEICDKHEHVFPTEAFPGAAAEDEREREIAALQQRAAALETEVAQRKELEKALRDALAARRRAEDQNAFLLDATSVLTSSLDYETRLTDLANLAVPRLADWCAVDVVRDDGTHHRVGLVHADPERAGAARSIAAVYRPEADHDPVARVIQTGVPKVVGSATDGDLVPMLNGPEHGNGFRAVSWLIVPMKLGYRTLGAMTLVAAESGRHYSDADVPLATELAHRAAIAIENARLYHFAQQANRAKDEFLATLSHELRTPLTAILGWAKMLTFGNLDAETIQTAIHTIERSARAQATLIDDLLDLSKIVTGKIVLRTELVDVATIVESAVQTLRLAADAKTITLDVAPLSERLVVKGDPTRLQQIVWNLLSNSVKFSESGQSVKVEIARVDGTVKITVRDEGSGITADFLPHVFEPFRQADGATTRMQSGLGLGLAIVKYLAELHGGRVTAASEGNGCGSTFTITLPLASQNVTQAEALGVGDDVDLRGASVLLVDDDADTRLVVSTILTRCGADVQTADSVDGARRLLLRERPSIIITDIAMPEKDGFALLDFVRMHGNEWRDLPVLALTAFSHAHMAERLRIAGFNAHITKPIDPVHFARVVADAIVRRA